MPTTSQANNRIVYLDVLRIVAGAVMVFGHARMLYYGVDHRSTLHAVHTTLLDGPNIFLMITGALLLPVTRSWREFMARRLPRVAWPLLVWTVVYLVIGFARGTRTWRDVLMLPIMPANGILWYLYMLIVIYITLPVASVAIEAMGKRGVQVYLVLWVLSSLIPFEHGVITSLTPPQHPLAMFHNCYGYVVLGYYLRRWPLPLFTWRHGWWIALVMVLGMVAVPWFEFTCQPDLSWHDHIKAVSNIAGINAVMVAVLAFAVVQRLVPERHSSPGRLSTLLATVSDSIYGIYLMHMAVMILVTVPVINRLLPACATQWQSLSLTLVAAPVLTLAVSLTLTLVIKRLPYSKYIIGH